MSPGQMPCRTVPDSLARALCLDCDKEVAGCLALAIIVQDGEVGIMVGITEGGDFHSLCRVQLAVIPVVQF